MQYPRRGTNLCLVRLTVCLFVLWCIASCVSQYHAQDKEASDVAYAEEVLNKARVLYGITQDDSKPFKYFSECTRVFKDGTTVFSRTKFFWEKKDLWREEIEFEDHRVIKIKNGSQHILKIDDQDVPSSELCNNIGLESIYFSEALRAPDFPSHIISCKKMDDPDILEIELCSEKEPHVVSTLLPGVVISKDIRVCLTLRVNANTGMVLEFSSEKLGYTEKYQSQMMYGSLVPILIRRIVDNGTIIEWKTTKFEKVDRNDPEILVIKADFSRFSEWCKTHSSELKVKKETFSGYPWKAFISLKEARVVMGIIVNKEGRVVDANVIESEEKEFNDIALNKTLGLLFKMPPHVQGKKEVVYTVRYVDFTNRNRILK